MIKHIVFFQFPSATDELCATLKTKLESMIGKIEVLKSLEAGIDIGRSERSFDAVLITTHDDLEGLQAYAVHPIHQEVVTWIKGQNITTKVVDYTF